MNRSTRLSLGLFSLLLMASVVEATITIKVAVRGGQE